jgi:hypothetical protein
VTERTHFDAAAAETSDPQFARSYDVALMGVHH